MTPLLNSSFTVAYVVSSSLGSFLSSLIYGAVVLAAIGAALAFIMAFSEKVFPVSSGITLVSSETGKKETL